MRSIIILSLDITQANLLNFNKNKHLINNFFLNFVVMKKIYFVKKFNHDIKINFLKIKN